MKPEQITQEFYAALSERLREKGFSTHITSKGFLAVSSTKTLSGEGLLCEVGGGGEVYCNSADLKRFLKKRDLESVLETVSDLLPQMEQADAPEQDGIGGMTLG